MSGCVRDLRSNRGTHNIDNTALQWATQKAPTKKRAGQQGHSAEAPSRAADYMLDPTIQPNNLSWFVRS